MIRFVPIVFLFGCGAFVPADGDWVSDSFAWTDDGCGVDDGSSDGEGDTTTLTNNEDGTFTLRDDSADGDFELVCTLDGQDFTCASQENREDLDGADVTIVSSFSAAGAFADEETVGMDMTVALSCEGADCAAAIAASGANIPCESTAHIEASWAGE